MMRSPRLSPKGLSFCAAGVGSNGPGSPHLCKTGPAPICAEMVQEPEAARAAALPPRTAGTIHWWNAGSAVFLFTSRVIVSLVQLRYVEWIWGGPYSGLNVLSNQILLYVTLLELGLAQSAISFLYQPIVNGEHRKASALVAALQQDVRRLIYSGAVFIFPLLTLYGSLLHAAVPLSIVIFTLWLVALTGLMQLAALHYQVYLNAAERLGWVNLILGTGYLLKTLIGLSLAIYTRQYLWLPVSSTILTLGEVLGMRVAFRVSFPGFTKVNHWRGAAKSIRLRAKFALIHKAAGLAYYQSDFIILSLTTTLLVVRDYAKYQYLSAALLSMVSTIAMALTSTFARAQLGSSVDGRWRQYAAVQLAAAVLGASVMLSYWFTAPAVVRMVFRQGADLRWFVLAAFGLTLFLNIIKIADDIVLTTKGAFQVGYWIPILEVPIFILLGLVLSWRLGFFGVLLASIITNLSVSVVMKGLVLADKVFDSSGPRWFSIRLVNTVKACVFALPLILLHFLMSRPTISAFAQDALWSSIAILYTLFVLRQILSRLKVVPDREYGMQGGV